MATQYHDEDADLSIIQSKKVAVIGYGSQGHAHSLSLRDSGVDVRVGLAEGSKSRAKAEAEGLRVLNVADAVKEADIVVTASGCRDLITEKHFRLMKDKAIVCNIGHFDIEIDMAWINTNYGHTKDTIKPQVDLYNIDGKEVIVLAEGRLVNLGCATGHPSFVMSNSFSNQTLAQIELWNHHDRYENKVYVLPKHLDEKVARLHLTKVGAQLEELTEAQAEYLGIPKDGPYKTDHYRY